MDGWSAPHIKKRISVWILLGCGFCCGPSLLADGPGLYANVPDVKPRGQTADTSRPAKPAESTISKEPEQQAAQNTQDRPDGQAEAAGQDPFENRVLSREPADTSQTASPSTSDPSTTAIPDTSASMWNMIKALVIVLAMIAVLAWFFKRWGFRSRGLTGGGAIEVLARTHMGPRQSLCLVKLAGRLLLIGQSANHMAILLSLEDPEEISQILGQLEKKSGDSITNTFQKLFHRESREYEQMNAAPEAEFGPEGADAELKSAAGPQDGHWSQAHGELSSLVRKVKGLARLRRL